MSNDKKKDLLDDKLWNYAMGETKKISKKKLYQKKIVGNEFSNSTPVEKNDSKKVIVKKITLNKKKENANLKNDYNDYSYSNIDRSILSKLKKGKLLINKTLDLHGLSQKEAYNKLFFFIESSYNIGERYLLVITGKGKKEDLKYSEKLMHQNIGILRISLPRWLQEDKFKSKIISHKEAFNRHGGEGARYIILRKHKL